ncbi:MAG: LysR family transcriptional regulator, partial [Pseudomonas sp.]
MRRLPSLTALRAFECAARHAHFGRAAAELCVTDSAVSHQIRQLEEQLGATLFIREGRQVSPTPAARRLLQSLQQAFELILEACDELRDPGSQAVLRIAVTAELAQKWLVSRLADFSARYPQI